MNVLGYVNFNQYFDNETYCLNVLKEQNCSVVYSERNDDFSCQEWKNFVNTLRRGDTAVFISLGSAFKDSLRFSFFYKLCDRNDIRIISLKDGFDTEVPSARNALCAITRLPCMPRYHEQTPKKQIEAEMVTFTHEAGICRKHKTVINMYNADYGIAKIQEVTGYKAKSQIFKILDMYNIERRHPTMARKKKGC